MRPSKTSTNDIGWEWVSLESVKLDRIESFSSWSEEARSVLKELLTNGSPREPVVSQIAKGHVALCSMVYRPRAAQREAILKGEKISVLGDSSRPSLSAHGVNCCMRANGSGSLSVVALQR